MWLVYKEGVNMSALQWTGEAVLGYAILAGSIVKPRRFYELVRPIPKTEPIYQRDLLEFLAKDQQFVITAAPYGNWVRPGVPANSNRVIGSHLSVLVKGQPELLARVLTQEEVAHDLKSRQLVLPSENVLIPKEKNAHVQTDIFFEWAAERSRQLFGLHRDDPLPRNFNVGFRGHVQRCKLTAIKKGFAATTVVKKSLENDAYDSQSGQIWCSGPIFWWPFEMLAARPIMIGRGSM
jgi:hypothetical protein